MSERLIPRNEPPAGRRLRIALVTETWRPEVNGVSHTLGRLVDGLLRQGHTVELVRPRQTAQDAPREEAAFTERLVRGMPIPFYPALRLGLPVPGQLARHWRRVRPDIVHVATEGPLGLAAINAARRLDIPLSSSFHSNFDAYSRHYGIGWVRGAITRYLRNFHNRTALTLVPTGRLAHSLAASGYRSVGVMARGVDTALFNPTRRSTYLRSQWGVRDDTLVVAHVGRLAAEKNIDLALRAHAAIAARHTDTRLLFVGDGPLRRDLERRHPEHLFAGMRSGIDLAEHYASADLFLFPSQTETYGNVTLEALASGLPVVAYDLAAASELIVDGQNGQLVAPGREDAFIAASAALAIRPERLGTLRQRARQSVAHLGWERIQDQFAARLLKVIRAHDRRQNLASGLLALPD